MTPALRWSAVIAIGAAAALAGYWSAQRPEPAQAVPQGSASDQAREALLALTLPDTAGRMLGLRDGLGHIQVVNFWATWCPPCLKEIPAFAATSRRYADKGVRFMGIGVDRAENIQSFQASQQVPYPLLVATPNVLSLSSELGNRAQGLPFSLILDPAGRIAFVKLGVLDEAELSRQLDALLARR